MTARPALPRLAANRNIAGYIFILSVMWYAGASQNNGAAFLLLFLVLGVMIASIPRALGNLTALRATAASVKPVFAGQEASLPVEIANPSRHSRHSLAATFPDLPDSENNPGTVDEIPGGQAAWTAIRFPAAKRGEHEISSILLSSSYPLGFLRARLQVPVRQRYLVYPGPAGDPNLPRTPGRKRLPTEGVRTESDDFAGVRAYLPGESQRHVDWKAVARGMPMMTKQFAAEGDGDLHFDFDALSVRGTEQRLSQLTLWVIEAERARRRYSLRLPSSEIPASLGETHYHKCLRALALHR